MPNSYCTIVDAAYVDRAVALYRSIRLHNSQALFSIFCIDHDAERLLRSIDLPGCGIIAQEAFETEDLRSLRAGRKTNEYCWSLKPVVLQETQRRFPDSPWHVYLDGDMMAFAEPDLAFADSERASVVLTPHRPSLPFFAEFVPRVGKFNAGYAAYRNDSHGRDALAWWETQCRALCPSEVIGDAYADQKYLDRLSESQAGVVISTEPGLNAAPWNIIGQPVVRSGRRILLADGRPLILYHMQGTRRLGPRLFDAYPGPVAMPRPVLDHIYRPYVRLWQDATARVAAARRALGLAPLHPAPLTLREWSRHLVRTAHRRSNLIWADRAPTIQAAA